MQEHPSRPNMETDVLLPAERLVELWQMPMRLWFSWWETCFILSPTHPLTPKEAEDKVHAQLVVPEPLKSSGDAELFA